MSRDCEAYKTTGSYDPDDCAPAVEQVDGVWLCEHHADKAKAVMEAHDTHDYR